MNKALEGEQVIAACQRARGSRHRKAARDRRSFAIRVHVRTLRVIGGVLRAVGTEQQLAVHLVLEKPGGVLRGNKNTESVQSELLQV